MDAKFILSSKTFWANVTMLALALVNNWLGALALGADEQAAILVIVNLVLRLVTKTPVTLVPPLVK